MQGHFLNGPLLAFGLHLTPKQAVRLALLAAGRSDNGVMALLATIAATGEQVESFSISETIWKQWRQRPIGDFVIGRHHVPAVLKRSPRGLQFFAAAAGCGGSTEPESVDHQLAKAQLVIGMRAAGYVARVEQPGTSSTGETWQADVLVQSVHGPLAVEVQLSRQHWDDYRHRTARYRNSGVHVVWLVRGAHTRALFNSLIRYHMTQGHSLSAALNRGMEDMPCIPLAPAEDGEAGFSALVRSPGCGPLLRLPLDAFGAGVARGALCMGEIAYRDGTKVTPAWVWRTHDKPSFKLPPFPPIS